MPVFLAPLVAWIAQFVGNVISTRAFKLLMAGVYVASILAFFAAVTALLNTINTAIPPVLQAGFAMFMPADLPAQITTIAALYALGWFNQIKNRVIGITGG